MGTPYFTIFLYAKYSSFILTSTFRTKVPKSQYLEFYIWVHSSFFLLKCGLQTSSISVSRRRTGIVGCFPLSAVLFSMVSVTPVNHVLEADDPLVSPWKVNSSLTLCHSAYVITSLLLITQHVIPSHVITRRVSTVQKEN